MPEGMYRTIRFWTPSYEIIDINGPPPRGVTLVMVEHFTRPATQSGFVKASAAYCDRPLYRWKMELDLTAAEYYALERFFRATRHLDFWFRHTNGRIYEVSWWSTELNPTRVSPNEFSVGIELLTADEPDGETAPPVTTADATTQEETTFSPTTSAPTAPTSGAAGTSEPPQSVPGDTTGPPPTSAPGSSTPPPTSFPGSSDEPTTAPPTTEAPSECSGGQVLLVRAYDPSIEGALNSRVMMIWPGAPAPIPTTIYANLPTAYPPPSANVGNWSATIPGIQEINLRLLTDTVAELRVRHYASGQVWTGQGTFADLAAFEAGGWTIDLGNSAPGNVAGGTVTVIPCDGVSIEPTSGPNTTTTPPPDCCERAYYFVDIAATAINCPFCYLYTQFQVYDNTTENPVDGDCYYFWRAPQVPSNLEACLQTGTGGGSQRPYAELLKSGSYWYLNIKEYGGAMIVSYRRLISGWNCASLTFFDKVAGTGAGGMCAWPAQARISPFII